MTRDPSRPAPESPERAALLEALASLLEPLARLAVARGVSYRELEALAKAAFVRAAHAAHPDLPEHRRVSRISTTTGLSRREVTRIVQAPGRAAPPRSLATEVFARWMTDSEWRDGRGRPRKLARQGPAPSFEALAQSITRDVHPRSLLEELVRLDLASVDDKTDTVSLVRDAFVPRGDAVRMARFLGENVGDHLAGAVDNVLQDGTQHFEQAVFADGLSEESLAAFRALVTAQWKTLRQVFVPELEKLIEADRKAERAPDRRIRIGLYTYTESTAPAPAAAPAAKSRRSAPRKTAPRKRT
jgi:hypothetical protein